LSRRASSGVMRPVTLSNRAVLTSARIAEAIRSSVENPGSSSDSFTSSSSATLIRSGGWFFTSAAALIASPATIRVRSGSNTAPTRSRTSSRCYSAVRAAASGMVR
jgi:hypothetical protein